MKGIKMPPLNQKMDTPTDKSSLKGMRKYILTILVCYFLPQKGISDEKKSEIVFLGSLPFISDITCGVVSLKESGAAAACFGVITPFTATFLTTPLHIYKNTSLKKYVFLTFSKLLLSLLPWGYSVGAIVRGPSFGWGEDESEKRFWREYTRVVISVNLLLAGINVYELVDGLSSPRKERTSSNSLGIYFIPAFSPERAVFQIGMHW